MMASGEQRVIVYIQFDTLLSFIELTMEASGEMPHKGNTACGMLI